ncbi:MAG: penicillin-binding protein, partial [Eubacteriales bacterium]
MKKVAFRGALALILSGILMVGLGVFLISYFVSGQDWVTFSGSPHVYTGGNLNAGIIQDRDDAVLLDTSDSRVYAQDQTLREATLHWFGDREGYIGAPMLTYYADDLV